MQKERRSPGVGAAAFRTGSIIVLFQLKVALGMCADRALQGSRLADIGVAAVPALPDLLLFPGKNLVVLQVLGQLTVALLVLFFNSADAAEKLRDALKAQTFAGEKVRVRLDNRPKEAVDKMWEWTRKGAPLIVEVGAKDLEKNAVMFRNRIKINRDGWKNFEDVDVFIATISEKLQAIQDEMLARANERLTQNVVTDIKTAAEFEAYFANANVYLENGGKAPKVAFVRGKWSGDEATLDKLKEMRLTIRCIPFDQSGSEGECLLSGKKATLDVIYARSY